MLEKSDNGFTDPTITIEGMGNIIGSNNIVNIKSELGKADQYLAKSVPPATTKSFTGRAKELSNLFKLLCGNQKVTKIVALYGMGGVGKTSLALKFANEFRAKFPGGIYWADFASTRGNPWPILRAWARLLHQDIGQLTDINTCVEIMRSAFHKHIIEYGSILLIVDDVRESWFEAVQILKSACPSNAPVLLTTRDVELAHSLGSTTILHLDVLSTDCAVDLLGKLAGSSVRQDQESAFSLARQVGCLPLALKLLGCLAARRATKPGWELSKLCAQLKSAPVIDLQTRGQQGLAATFSLSYDELSERQKVLFRTLGVFDAVALSANQIAWALDWGIDETETMLDALHDLSLVRWQEYNHSDETYYELHPLIYEFAQYLTPIPERRELRLKLSKNIVKALTNPDITSPRIVALAESLMALDWINLAESLKSLVLDALRSLMADDTQSNSIRRAAASLLMRLNWLFYISDASVNEISTCLELFARYIESPVQRLDLVASITASLQQELTDHQRARLLAYRAALLGALEAELEQPDFLKAAFKDYLEADEIVAKLVPADHKLQALVSLGKANILVIQAESTEEAEEKQGLLVAATKLYNEGIYSVNTYGQDVVLNALIHKELSYAFALLEQWDAAEEACLEGLRLLEDRHSTIRTWLLETICDINLQKAFSLLLKADKKSALAAYQACGKFAVREIKILKKLGKKVPGDYLVYAYINYADCMWGVAQLLNEKPVKDKVEALARKYWILANTLEKEKLSSENIVVKQSRFYAIAQAR